MFIGIAISVCKTAVDALAVSPTEYIVSDSGDNIVSDSGDKIIDTESP